MLHSLNCCCAPRAAQQQPYLCRMQEGITTKFLCQRRYALHCAGTSAVGRIDAHLPLEGGLNSAFAGLGTVPSGHPQFCCPATFRLKSVHVACSRTTKTAGRLSLSLQCKWHAITWQSAGQQWQQVSSHKLLHTTHDNITQLSAYMLALARCSPLCPAATNANPKAAQPTAAHTHQATPAISRVEPGSSGRVVQCARRAGVELCAKLYWVSISTCCSLRPGARRGCRNDDDR
jgi:hypothetical protein